jgi:hypothetical protein
MAICNSTFGCEDPDWNQCLISTCVDGQTCVVEKNPLVQCATADDCSMYEMDCFNCTCIPRNMTEIT